MTGIERDNLYAGIPDSLPEERSEVLGRGENVRIERIVSRGHCSPPGFWYEQPEREWVLLIKGEARLRFERGNRTVPLRAGDYLDIPAGSRHRVDWTAENGETVWIAVFYR